MHAEKTYCTFKKYIPLHDKTSRKSKVKKMIRFDDIFGGANALHLTMGGEGGGVG